MRKLTIPFEKAWLIRIPESETPFGTIPPSHWVAGNKWDASPMHATIFRSEEDAQYQIDDMRHHNRAGFSATTVVEAVPLEGAAKTPGNWMSVRDLWPGQEGGDHA